MDLNAQGIRWREDNNDSQSIGVFFDEHNNTYDVMGYGFGAEGLETLENARKYYERHAGRVVEEAVEMKQQAVEKQGGYYELMFL